MNAFPDYAAMDDPDLIAERGRIRAELERLGPESDAGRDFRRLYDATTAEIGHRARLAWSAA